MAYKALYRTYRPQSFNEIIGQEAVVRTLQNEIKENKISHAYLFSGPRGTGKTSIARVFAKALNCTNTHNSEPCNECDICKEITEGVNPDVIEIDAASNNGVDEIRAMKDRIGFLPAGSKYKIYIIDEVHMLSVSAFNALLKTLEEPPKHVIFILATTEPHKILQTVLSRCQRYDFKSLTVDEITNLLMNVCEKENVEYDLDALIHIAQASDGGLRDALSYLDQAMSFASEMITDEDVSNVTGLVTKEKIFELSKTLKNKELVRALSIIEELQNSGKEVGKIVTGLLEFYRDILMSKNLNQYKDERYKEYGMSVTLEELFYYIDVLSDVQNKLKYSSSSNIYLEVAIIRIVNNSQADLDYLKRLSALEEKINNKEIGEQSVKTNAYQSNTNNFNGNDIRKLNELDDKFNGLLNFLSKMELQKVNNRLASLEQTTSQQASNVQENGGNKELNAKINQIVEDVEFLKITQKSMQNKIDNTSTGGIDEETLDLKIEEATKKVKLPINYTEIESFIKRQVNQLLEDIKEKLAKIEDSETEKLKRIEELEAIALQDNKEKEIQEKIIEVRNEPVDLSQIEDRISKFESTVYKMISNLLSTNSKKTKQKIDYKQISFWNDDVTELDKINSQSNNTSSKIKVDFDNLSNTKEVKEDSDDAFERDIKIESDNEPKMKQTDIYELIEEQLKENSLKDNEINNDILDNNNIGDNAGEVSDINDVNLEKNNDSPEEDSQSNLSETNLEQEELIDKQNQINQDNIVVNDDSLEEPNSLFEDDYQQEILSNELDLKDLNSLDIDNLDDSSLENEDSNRDGNIINFEEDNPGQNTIEDNNKSEDENLDKPEMFENDIDNFSDNLFSDEPKDEGINLFAFDDKDLSLDEEVAYEENKKRERQQEVREILLRKKEENNKHENKYSQNKELDSKKSEIKLPVNKLDLDESNNEHNKDITKDIVEDTVKDIETNDIVDSQKPDKNLNNENLSNKEPNSESNDLDEYERYDIKVFERIVNDYKSGEFDNELRRILALWNNLLDLAPSDKRGTAEMLKEGIVRIVGNHEFIITYDKASICNQVMGRKFKKNSLKLLFDLLKTDYNYLAIPHGEYESKMRECVAQYGIGTTIKLTPFKDPNLRVTIVEDDADIMAKRIREIFGDMANIKRSDK